MKDNSTVQPRILVAGASGHLGHRVTEILHEQGYINLVAASRNPLKLGDLNEKGIEVRKADFDDPGTLKHAFLGIDRLLLISTDELHNPDKRVRQHTNAIKAAKAAGIKHIVYTSMPSPEKAHDIPFASDHVATEKALENSGLDFTSLRVSWYAENLMGFLPQIISAGKWPTVSGDGRIPYIPREDVAQAAANALMNNTGKTYPDISGVESLSINDIASIASEVFGKTISVLQVPINAIMEELIAIGIPAGFAPTVVMTDLNMRSGNFDIVSNDVKKATGREPKRLNEFLINNKNKFIL
ncbi:SDR family oxidoreductase [Pedobacter sandarakinus]|uniref:SDR family oxidoreductase n=1 Tax=Pedobacter sandarakinus TaxID=353156 RepID=UPI0022461E6C|nr:SDR family oxidoreductase [Pedobacter sandarakinus]MCX2574057.1 SDR family oxidoreductase [Pedobacter sandarakinus]